MVGMVQQLYFHHLHGPQTQLRGKEQRSRCAREEVSQWEPITAFWFLVPVPSGSHLHSFQFPKTLCPCNKLSFFFVNVRLNLFQLFEKGNTQCKPYNHKINQNCAVKRTQTPDSGRSKLVSLKMGCLVHYPRLFGPCSLPVKCRV